DRLFISDLEQNSHSATIVRTAIGLARGLKLPVAAEGVETEAQLAFLAHEGCDEVQGHLLGRPHPIDEYADVVGRISLPKRKSALASGARRPAPAPSRGPRVRLTNLTS